MYSKYLKLFVSHTVLYFLDRSCLKPQRVHTYIHDVYTLTYKSSLIKNIAENLEKSHLILKYIIEEEK